MLRDSTESKLHESGLLNNEAVEVSESPKTNNDLSEATLNTKTSIVKTSEPASQASKPDASENTSAASRTQNERESGKPGKQPEKDATARVPSTMSPNATAQAKSGQALPVQAIPVQTQSQNEPSIATPARTTDTPAIAKAIPVVSAKAVPAKAVPVKAVAISTPTVPQSSEPAPAPSPKNSADQLKPEHKPKFGEKKPIQLSPGAKKAALYGGIGAALVFTVLLCLVLIQKVISSGPARAFEAYKSAVQNNDFAALYDIVDTATRDTYDNFADASAKENPVDHSLRGKEKFVAVASQRFESFDDAKRKIFDAKLRLVSQATIISESINRNRASVQIKFEEEVTESITFEKIDGEWKIGVPSFSALFVEY